MILHQLSLFEQDYKEGHLPPPTDRKHIGTAVQCKAFFVNKLKTAYWQMGVNKRDRDETASIMPHGLCELKGFVQHLRLSRTRYCRPKWQSCLLYSDDDVVFSENFDDHLRQLETVLQVVRSSRLALKPEKCHFTYEATLPGKHCQPVWSSPRTSEDCTHRKLPSAC